MICPNCSSNIPDGSLTCPACRAALDNTMQMPSIGGCWCERCGSLIPDGSPTCPGCGLPNPEYVEPAATDDGGEARAVDGDDPLEADQTNSMPRIESAIPSESDEGATVIRDRLPRMRVIVGSLLIGVLAMSAIVVTITHPWDPNAFDTKAKTEADTSMAGFPGHVSELQGQDGTGSGQSGEVRSGDEVTFEKLVDIHSELGELATLADENEALFERIAITGSESDRSDGKSDADALAIQISNLIDRIDAVDVTSGIYADDAANLKTLGNWLRNRTDALCEAWALDVSSGDPSSSRDAIDAVLHTPDGTSVTKSFKALFDQNYAMWALREKTAS